MESDGLFSIFAGTKPAPMLYKAHSLLPTVNTFETVSFRSLPPLMSVCKLHQERAETFSLQLWPR